MRACLIGLVLLLISTSATGGASSVNVFGFVGSPVVSVTRRMPADFVSMTVTVSSDRRNPAERAIEVDAGQQALIQAAARNPGVEFEVGPPTLSGRTGSKFSFSSYGVSSEAEVTLLKPIAVEGASLFPLAAQLHEFVTAVSAPGKCEYRVGQMRLGIRDPERFRPELLRAIAADVEKTRQALGGSGSVTVSGLGGPVRVRQVSDTAVELFIAYDISISLNGM